MALTLTQLQDYINTNVKANGRKAITGDIMNYLMLQFVDWVDTYSALPDKGGHNSEFLRVNSAGTALEWAAVQAPLVSGTNIKTINGTSLLGSGDITISSGLTIGSTAITSGTDTRIIFQNGGVIQQSSGLTFNNGLFTVKTGASTRFYVGNDATYKTFDLCSSVWADGFKTYMSAPGGSVQVEANGNGLNLASNYGIYISSVNQISNYTNSILRTFIDVNGNFGIGNSTSLGARLDVRAKGALSSDIALRVRNSADTINIFEHSGSGQFYFRGNSDAQKYIYWDGNAQIYLKAGSAGGAFNIDNQAGELTLRASTNLRLAGNGVGIYMWDTGNIFIGGSTGIIQGNGAKNVIIPNGTAPTINITDAVYIYSADIVAGNAAPHFRTEAGDIIKLYKQSASGVSTVADVVTVLTNLGLLA